MHSGNGQRRRVSTTLVREATDWGLAVSEKRVRFSFTSLLLLVLGVCLAFWGLLFVVPLLVGMLLSAETSSLGLQLMAIGGLVSLGVILGLQSRKGPRNALELDQRASQLRIGFHNRYGAFVRRRVIPLKQVKDAKVGLDAKGKPELNIVLQGEQIRIALADAKEKRLIDIAAQIREAAELERSGPRRSRIESSIAGIGASYREMTNRVTSRIFQ